MVDGWYTEIPDFISFDHFLSQDGRYYRLLIIFQIENGSNGHQMGINGKNENAENIFFVILILRVFIWAIYSRLIRLASNKRVIWEYV